MPARRRPLARRTGLAPMSPARAAAVDERAEVRAVVFARDGRCLLSHLVESGACVGRPTFHHLEKAWKRAPYTVENGVTLCERHNGWVEDWPPMARRLGLVVGWDPDALVLVDHSEAARRRQAHGLVPRAEGRTHGDV